MVPCRTVDPTNIANRETHTTPTTNPSVPVVPTTTKRVPSFAPKLARKNENSPNVILGTRHERSDVCCVHASKFKRPLSRVTTNAHHLAVAATASAPTNVRRTCFERYGPNVAPHFPVTATTPGETAPPSGGKVETEPVDDTGGDGGLSHKAANHHWSRKHPITSPGDRTTV